MAYTGIDGDRIFEQGQALVQNARVLSERAVGLVRAVAAERGVLSERAASSVPGALVDADSARTSIESSPAIGDDAETPEPTRPATAAEAELAEVYRALAATMVQLRSTNRLLHMSASNARRAIAESKQDVDTMQLELHNLHYRQRFLRREIGMCKDFVSLHEQVEFVAMDEFVAAHAEYAADGTLEDAHRLTLARLADERARRQALEARRRELQAVKASLVEENKRRASELEKLEKQLQGFIESAHTIQGVLEKQ
ncbi:Fms-interacting protein-domain-containing protein [Dipodascopsis tothii]|uniref:Fms-interacting protein-domain-containing protein n=1 Tax=Dipodascopsis tothii TaxID=44089 RepID=UPI0034CF2A8C